MIKVDWNSVEEKDGFDNPIPGAYVAEICFVEDHEDKQYLKILWDFASGEFKGNNRETYDRAGFWPISLTRSYKPKALGFFKAFKTTLEESNPGYQFDESNLDEMVGKKVCVVLGEEEYQGNDGSVKTRLYVYQTRSMSAYQKGDFKVPELKRLSAGKSSGMSWNKDLSASSTPGYMDSFAEIAEEEKELPF